MGCLEWCRVARGRILGCIRLGRGRSSLSVRCRTKKGSADLASNVVTLEMVHTLEAEPNLKVESGAGSPVVYVTFNVTDPVLKDKRVRQAVASAIDRQAIVDAIWRGQARLANTLLPTGHWAAATDDELAH